jgi:outer membrane biosynthesis protein TonB
MKTKFFPLIVLIGFAGACIAQAQSPTPGESPAQSPSPAKETPKPEATPSPAKADASPTATPKAKPRAKKEKARPATTPAPAKTTEAEAVSRDPAPGGGPGLVWANTDTRVYHRIGSRFYGTTKKGKYMTEGDAVSQGYKPAGKPR